MISPLLTIDVAHPSRRPAAVEAELLDAWTTARNSSRIRIVKIIHGYGSTGTGGSIRTMVRNWAFANRRRFRAVIPGEEYDVLDAMTQELRKEVGDYDDPDLSTSNPGMTVIWVR